MTNGDNRTIPVGDIQFSDNYVPALDAGNWFIQADHSLAKDGAPLTTDSLAAIQEFVVSAPQFSLDPKVVLNKYPPDASAGRYGEVLPHIVLSDPLLPWERAMADASARQPWLALLVFEDGELLGASGSPTRATTTTVAGFLAPDPKILKPAVQKEDDVADTDSCVFIQLPAAVFQAIAPRLAELRFLAHCREANTADKAVIGDAGGLYSVVVANRFPAAPPGAADPPVKNIVHLVSLEGLEPYLVANPEFGGHDSVALVSLASWTFQALPDHAEDFRGLMTAIVGQELSGGAYQPDNLWLRVRASAGGEAQNRLDDGFVPLAYRTRTGERTFAWYRGPLVPVLTTAPAAPGPFATADAAIIYQSALGVFDLSLAAAWEIGRATALSDKVFGQRLLDLRARTHALTDQLLHRLQSDAFSADQIASLDGDTRVQDEFLRVLEIELLQDIGAPPDPSLVPPRPAGPTDTDPKAAVANFLADPAVQALILQAVEADLDPVATWLARLLLLYPVSFSYLVPDARALPIESLRFFYLDNAWLAAALDGALSLGLDSSRQTFLFELTRDLTHAAAYEAARAYRDNLRGVPPSPVEVNENLVSGLVMRSAVVSGWPNLAVRPYLQNGQLLKILRIDHLSPNVLLCLFQGVPDYVELSEPQEGFRFGTDDDGSLPLRYPTSAGGPALPLGKQLDGATPLAIRDLTQTQARCMRAATSRVLNIDPGAPAGLVQSLTAALEAVPGVTLDLLGPADLALQMVKAPEAIKFTSEPRT